MSMRQHAALLDCGTEALTPAYGQFRPYAGAAALPPRDTDQRRRRILTSTVELDVIPRLLLQHRAESKAGSETGRPFAPGCDMVERVNGTEVADLVDLLLERDEPDAFGFVEQVHRRGASPEAVLLELLTPAARRLGVLWELDECDFTAVTIGLWRLQGAMSRFRPHFMGKADLPADAPRALLVPLPGEQHGFGIAMVSDFFCRAGWNAWSGPVGTSAELAAMVRGQWTDVIGFSLACDDRLDTLAAEIRRVRRASCNPALGVLVGGPAFARSPHLAVLVGADATAADGLQAVAQARRLLDLSAERRGTVVR